MQWERHARTLFPLRKRLLAIFCGCMCSCDHIFFYPKKKSCNHVRLCHHIYTQLVSLGPTEMEYVVKHLLAEWWKVAHFYLGNWVLINYLWLEFQFTQIWSEQSVSRLMTGSWAALHILGKEMPSSIPGPVRSNHPSNLCAFLVSKEVIGLTSLFF